MQPNDQFRSIIYSKTITKRNNAINEYWSELANQKSVVFHHNNARPHTHVCVNLFVIILFISLLIKKKCICTRLYSSILFNLYIIIMYTYL